MFLPTILALCPTNILKSLYHFYQTPQRIEAIRNIPKRINQLKEKEKKGKLPLFVSQKIILLMELRI
jgi:hypothetical protein